MSERLATTGPVFGGGRSSALTVNFSPICCSGSVAGLNAVLAVPAAGGAGVALRCASAGTSKIIAHAATAVPPRRVACLMADFLGLCPAAQERGPTWVLTQARTTKQLRRAVSSKAFARHGKDCSRSSTPRRKASTTVSCLTNGAKTSQQTLLVIYIET